MAFIDDIKSSFSKGDSMVRKLIFINIGAWILINVVRVFAFFITADAGNGDLVNYWFYLPAELSQFILQPWSLFTYMFAHEGLLHILFNMLILYFLGNLFQEYLGNKKLLRVYFWGGIAGGLFFMLGMNLIPVLNTPERMSMPLLGASAGVLAVVTGIATLIPNYAIRLFVFNIKLKYIALFYFVTSFFGLSGWNAGGNLAHVGGVILGYFYIKQIQNVTILDRWGDKAQAFFERLFGSKKKDERKMHRSYTVYMKTESDARPDQTEIDAILDKINKSGYDSLNKKEREMLFKASKDN